MLVKNTTPRTRETLNIRVGQDDAGCVRAGLGRTLIAEDGSLLVDCQFAGDKRRRDPLTPPPPQRFPLSVANANNSSGNSRDTQLPFFM